MFIIANKKQHYPIAIYQTMYKDIARNKPRAYIQVVCARVSTFGARITLMLHVLLYIQGEINTSHAKNGIREDFVLFTCKTNFYRRIQKGSAYNYKVLTIKG